jgi:peptidoglycan/LPS O-acetylase OafA/YrhL
MVALEKAPFPPATDTAPSASSGEARRIVALDGVRGMMTLFVLISHLFAEVPGGVTALMVGWVGVDMFFVLSGYLVGRLILEKRTCDNFFSVFYVRRFVRTIPAYMVTVLVVFGLFKLCDPAWSEAEPAFPLWAYLTFSQPAFMVATQSIGPHWLAPTWTLAMEEHFYLVAPAMIVFTPRRWLPAVLIGLVALAVGLRLAIFEFDFANPMAGLILLPSRGDLLAVGILAALAATSSRVPWARIDLLLRVTPLVALVAVWLVKALGGSAFDVFAPTIMAVGCAAYLLALVRNAPEARTMESRFLRFFGNNSYCIYLSHLPILGLMHGVILHARPGLGTPQQWAVTIAALPLCVLVGWGMTKLIEEPLTHWGRSWKWSANTLAR